MTLDQLINYSGWLIGTAGLAFGVWQYRISQSRPVIVAFRAGLSAIGTISSGNRSVYVPSLTVHLENKGMQSTRCTALVHFSRSYAWPLYPVVRSRVQQSGESFVLDGKTDIELVAAWKLEDGSVPMGGVPYADFVKDYLPAKVVVTYGKRTIEKSLTERDVASAHQRFEQDCFRMGS